MFEEFDRVKLRILVRIIMVAWSLDETHIRAEKNRRVCIVNSISR